MMSVDMTVAYLVAQRADLLDLLAHSSVDVSAVLLVAWLVGLMVALLAAS